MKYVLVTLFIFIVAASASECEILEKGKWAMFSNKMASADGFPQLSCVGYCSNEWRRGTAEKMLYCLIVDDQKLRWRCFIDWIPIKATISCIPCDDKSESVYKNSCIAEIEEW